jgi:putative ABC transport system permease protein
MVWTHLRQALRSLTVNKLRSFLTMLGIIIGVAAVIALVSLGAGASASVAEQFTSLGVNQILILPGPSQATRISPAAGSSRLSPAAVV